MRITRKMFVLALGVLAANACTKKSSDDPEAVPATDTSTAPVSTVSGTTPVSSTTTTTTTTTVAAPTLATVWVASNSAKSIAGYDANGNRLALVDLSAYLSAGGVTALSFVSKDVMLAFADPGANGERIFRIDLSTNSVSLLNSSWFMDTTNFTAMSAYSMVVWNSSKLIIPKLVASSVVEQLAYNINNNIVARVGAPWVANTLGSCLSTSNQYALPVTSSTGTKKLMVLSSSTNSRINIYGNVTGSVSCDGSYNFGTSVPSSTAYIPTGAVQGTDGKIYVRYQHATTPAIYRYDADASMTTLSAGTVVYNDTGYLSQDVVSRDMVILESDYVLLSNWSVDAIVKLNLLTGVTEFFAKDMFTVDVNAIAVRPAQ